VVENYPASKQVGELKKLTSLTLGGTNLTDAGLSALRGLTNLRELNLPSTRITDVGLIASIARSPMAD
jgi:Leucine-rich repeat (LRR) protein